MIIYTEEKIFTKEQVRELFLSVDWISGEYPERLYKALMNSSTVYSAWDGKKLFGLVRALDDSELVAFLHPDYQGQEIAGILIEKMKEKCKDYLYIELMPEESKNAAFYENHGFQIMENGVAMQLCNFSNKH